MKQPYSTFPLKNPIKNSDCSALPGKNGVAFFGGDGYSGGGGYNAPCNGGTDGGNGDCSDGGKGTGMDISTYPFDNFNLSPGGGGLHYTFGGLFGGGGGGVLINNEGPEMIFSKAGVQWSIGEGRDGNRFLRN